MVGVITGRAGLRAQDRYGLVIVLVMVSYAIGVTYGGSDLARMMMVLVALYALTPVVIVGHLARRPTVDLQTLSGAVAAYLLIGMTYAFLYVTVGEYQSAPFFAEHGDVTTAQYLFFSFTTLTTTGYGDLVPAGNPGQTLAISQAVLGQLFLVTALGKIVANLRPRLRVDEAAGDT